MFKRDHHVRIATALQALDAEGLARRGCLFGGGTAIVLANGEYRESVDIDFLISDHAGYRDLREILNGQHTLAPILRNGFKLSLSREIRADQYGIRTLLDLGGVEIKFEIVLEGRISLQNPTHQDKICGVSTLTRLDLVTSKLLANSDRWADDSVFSRDLIDLGMMDPDSNLKKTAIQKATTAYGASIESDLVKAINYLKARPGRLDDCMNALKMDSIPSALLWKKILKLRPRLN